MLLRLHPASVAGKPWPEFVQVNVGPAWTEEEAMRAQYAGPTRKSHERATAWHRFTNGSLNLLAYTLDQKVKDWQCPICECLLRSCEINGEIVDFKQHIWQHVRGRNHRDATANVESARRLLKSKLLNDDFIIITML